MERTFKQVMDSSARGAIRIPESNNVVYFNNVPSPERQEHFRILKESATGLGAKVLAEYVPSDRPNTLIMTFHDTADGAVIELLSQMEEKENKELPIWVER